MGEQALEAWVIAKMDDIEAYPFAQKVRHYLGPHADYLMRRALEVSKAMTGHSLHSTSVTGAVLPECVRS